MRFDLGRLLRRLAGATIWGLALSLASQTMASTLGIAAACLGGGLGFLAGPVAAASRLRLATLWAAGLGALALLQGLGWLAAGSAPLTRLLGPEQAWALGDAWTWGSGTFTLVLLLHGSTLRHPAALIAEIGVVGAALVSPLSAHRDGFISRPHFFVDALWSRGWDPVPFLILAGALAAATLLVLAVGRFNRRGTLPDLAALLGIALLASLFLPVARLQQLLPPQEPLELQGESQERGQPKPPPPMGGGGEGQGGGQSRQEPDPEQDSSSQSQPSPVAVVLFDQDFEPADGYYYFRQKTFSMFNGARLVADTTGQADRDLPQWFPAARPDPEGDPSGVGMTPEPLRPGVASEVETTVALIVPHTLPFGLLSPVAMEAQGNPDPGQFVRAYRVRSQAFSRDLSSLMGTPAGSPRWSPAQREHYTRLPDDPRYKALAREIVDRLQAKYRQDTLAQAVMIKLWLESEGTYSLRRKVLDQDDAVARFLFGDRTGYCVHFAHSAAYLCRAMGIPARVAAGYAADARYRFGGSTLVLMNSNSHAWCEIYLDGIGWVPLDVAPQQTEHQPPPPPDPDLQRMLGALARKEAPSLTGQAREKRDLGALLRRGVLLAGQGLALLLALVVAGLYAWKIGRRLAPWAGGGQALPRRVFLASLDRLADAGLHRPHGQTRERFAREQASRLPSLTPMTDLHVGAAFRTHAGETAPPRAELLRLHRELGREIARHVPWKRRLLGALNPFSWLFVR